MDTKLVTLNCPKCGSSEQTIDQELRFGLEYKCKHCGTSSVLIINNRLYMPLPGEKVCLSCGRVAERDARFCQCGQPLVRRCINQDCLREFPIDHLICDYCGWRQEVSPTSEEGAWLEFQHAMRDFFDPQASIHKSAYDDIMVYLGKCHKKEDLEKFITELEIHNIDPVPFLLNSLSPGLDLASIEFVLSALRKKGVDSGERAKEPLIRILEQSYDKETIDTTISNLLDMGVNAMAMQRRIISEFPSESRVSNAIRIIETHGESAFEDIEKVALTSSRKNIRTNAFNLMVNWVLLTEEGSKHRDKFVLTCAKYLNLLDENELSRVLIDGGEGVTSFIVDVMDVFDSYKMRKKCWETLVHIGKPALLPLKQLRKSKNVSGATREWIETAIKKIEGYYPGN